jgi:deoxyribose-phosphate aldolase
MDQPSLSPAQLAARIELTGLRADATLKDIEKLCAEARQHRSFGICVHGCRVELARHLLDGTDIKVIAVAGFPLGAGPADAKRYEVEVAIDDGAHEMDVVLNVGKLRDGENSYVLRELRDVVEAADDRPVKVILETPLLSEEEKIRACGLAVESGAKFVNTSTGFSRNGANIQDVALLRRTVGPHFGVKAAGGIRNFATALAMIAAGANRLGTSTGASILDEFEKARRALR